MGIRKYHPSIRQAIHMGRLYSRMVLQKADPIVQIIHRDEQNVGGLALCKQAERPKGNEKG